MKTEDTITAWIQMTIKEAYRLGYKRGLDHGMEMSAQLENIHEDEAIIRRDMNAKDLARAIIKEAVPKTIKTDMPKSGFKRIKELSPAAQRQEDNETEDYVKNNWKNILGMEKEDDFESAKYRHELRMHHGLDLETILEIDKALTAARDHYFPQKKKRIRRKKVIKKSVKRAPKKKKRKAKK